MVICRLWLFHRTCNGDAVGLNPSMILGKEKKQYCPFMQDQKCKQSGLKVVNVPSHLARADKVPLSKAFNHQTPKQSPQRL